MLQLVLQSLKSLKKSTEIPFKKWVIDSTGFATPLIKNNFGVEIPFPIIDDIKMEVAQAYGMIHPGAADTQAVRATFFIDPELLNGPTGKKE